MTVTGVVREFDSEAGWGVIDAPEVPGGCWAHFSAIAADGFRRLRPGQEVTFRFEAASQDGYRYRALMVWTGTEPAGSTAGNRASVAYRSSLTITFEDQAESDGR
ncbi:cold-shock protein [Micromonospora sp. H33]|uniref:cold-shock protein n=1 Tax=Micromonospora sp. H33 TaxID=3452215 RepID=UPI003F8CC106